jgi:hypothetical protein
VVDFAPDSAAYAVVLVASSVAVWAGIELVLFDGSTLMAVVPGTTCGLAIVFVAHNQCVPDER